MHEWLVRAAWWQLALVCAPVIAVVTTVVARLSREDTWGGAAVVGITAGVLCSAVLGGMMRAQFARTQELYDALPDGEDRAAVLHRRLAELQGDT